MAESLFESKGLTLHVHNPLALGNEHLYDVSDKVTDYAHELTANGGFKSAQVSLGLNKEDIEDWIQHGLGRRLLVYNPGMAVIWEGFVNTINASLGPVAITRGPLLSAPNRARLVYSSVDTSVTPPVVGIRKTTAQANNTVQQAKYGIIEKVLSCGGASDANAVYIRDTFLEENADPETSETLSLGGQQVSISLDCLGYYAWLGAYVFNSTTTGTQSIKVKLQAVLAANPNAGMFSTDYGGIATNAMTVGAYDNDDRLASDVLNGLVAMGDAAGARYTLGMYSGREVTYTAVPAAPYYQHVLGDRKSQITTMNEDPVFPWDVRPARWIFYPDVLPGAVPSVSGVQKGPRYQFIESVRFRLPNNLDLSGSKVNTLPQVLASLGLSGIGA